MTTNSMSSVPDSVSSKNLAQQDFLRLMVAQVQYQTPVQHQENDELLSPLTQFNTKDGITKMQESVLQMASSLQSNQALQASALVGRKVLINSNNLSLAAEGNVNTVIDMPTGINNLTASIYSELGVLIKTIVLEQTEPGFFPFNWDGTGQNNERLASGKYTVRVMGTFKEQEIELKTMISANVDSVSLGQNGEGLKLNVSGVGSVTLDQIRQITV